MKFVIKNTLGLNLGVIPYANILNGSGDIGDVVNSWITFTNAGMAKFPAHPLSVFNTIASNVVMSNLCSATEFGTVPGSTADPDTYDDIITFKGREYYVVDYTTGDHARTNATLEIIDKKQHDLQLAAQTSDATITENLDVLWTAIQKQWAPVSLPLAVTNIKAEPARSPISAPGVSGVAYAATPKATTIHTKHGDVDVAEAQLALSALLAKGSL